MKVIIAGSREITDYNLVKKAVESCPFEITEIVSGGARGVDKLGERYAKEHNIKVSVFPADWSTYGKAAGIIRNEIMGCAADALIAIQLEPTKGTQHMISFMKEIGKPYYVYPPKNRSLEEFAS